MNYLNIHTDILRSIEYLGADPVERATWLNLVAWCCTQENGGTILGASEWGDRKWQQLCGVTREEVQKTSQLYRINSATGSLVVSFYPKEKEAEVISKRKVAKRNGSKGGRPKKKVTNVGSSSVTNVGSFCESVKEGKGMEGNGREYTPNPFGELVEIEKDSELIPIDKSEASMLPANAKRIRGNDQKRTKCKGNTETMSRINGWFGRKPETLWTVAELLALIAIKPLPAELNGMEAFYLAEDSDGSLFRRQDLLTLLNNWQGELDKARGYARKQKGVA